MPKKKKSPIQLDPENEGKFTEKAKRRDMTVQQFAAYVLAHPEDFPPNTRRQANFARNAAHWKHRSPG